MQGYKYAGMTCTGCANLKFYDGVCKGGRPTKSEDGSIKMVDRPLDISFENASGYKVWLRPSWCSGKSTDVKPTQKKDDAV